MNDTTRPITIAGGGLAGLALGVALRERGVPVTLHEAGSYPRHRVCGEFLSGVSDETLDRLGIGRDLDDAVPLKSSCWRNDSRQLGEIGVSGRGISRHILDDRLQKRFTRLGGNLVTESRLRPREGVVWAAGRVRQSSPWIGLKCHVRDLELTHDLEMHVGTSGYAGLARIEGGLVNLCGLFFAGSASGKGINLLLACLQAGGLHRLAKRIEEAVPDPGSFCVVAGFRFGRTASAAFSIGDAALMIPPFTGNGMSMALEAADQAIQPAVDYAAGRISWVEAAARSDAAQRRHFRRRMSLASMIHPVMTSRPGLKLLEMAASARLLPYGALYRLLR
jgi:flavin-dependent dehydrogenase